MKTNNFIPQMEPWFDIEERRALDAYMSQGGWVTEFRKTKEFETLIAEYTGAKHCIVVNNGTISLTLAAMACGIEAGDEGINMAPVCIQTMTCRGAPEQFTWEATGGESSSFKFKFAS